MCGATSEMKALGAKTAGFFDYMEQEVKNVFGDVKGVFSDVISALKPIVAGGPSQHGMSLPEKAALESAAVTNSSIAQRNAMTAINQGISATGGGNVALPGGAAVGARAYVANAGAEKQAEELNKINQADFAIGRDNFFKAVGGEMQAPSVFNPAIGMAHAANAAGGSAAQTQKDISDANNSWINAVAGGLGGVASSVIDAYLPGAGGAKPGTQLSQGQTAGEMAKDW